MTERLSPEVLANIRLAIKNLETLPAGSHWGARFGGVTDELTVLLDFYEHSPIPMRITCPECKLLHIDEGEFATKPHHTHSCQGCGLTWRPAVVHTVGVQFLPGFKNPGKEDGGAP